MISNIQALRAFAAINVVLFHIIGTSKSYSQEVGWLGHLEGWGANGVDIFFVVSGFVMLHIQMIQRRSPFHFFMNRILRIVPIYWLLTLLFILLYLFFPSIFREMNITLGWAVSSFFFISSVFTNQHPIVYVGWTLEWEMFFYLMFSIGLFFYNFRVQVAFIVASLTCFSFITESYMVLEFLFGMLAAYFSKKLSLSKKQALYVFIFGFFALLLSLLPSVVSWELNRVLLWGVPSLFVVYGLVSCAQISSRFFTYLGDASYSIYLIQMLTIPAFYKFASKILGGWNGDLLALMCLILSVLFGCLVYSLAEKPVTFKLKRVFHSKIR
jgi:exopolysaccharide production protein ExoZ